MKEGLSMMKLMAKALLLVLMVPATQDSGKMVFIMEKVQRSGLMVQRMRAITNLA